MADSVLLHARHRASRWRSRAISYFGTIIAVIVLINTPLPKIVLTALLDEPGGRPIADSLQRSTRDLFLLLMVSIYFEWARGQEQVVLLREVHTGIKTLCDAFMRTPPDALREIACRATPAKELLRIGLAKHYEMLAPPPALVSRVLSKKRYFEDVTIHVRLDRGLEDEVSVTHSMRMRGHIDDMIIAVTRSAVHSSAIAASTDDLFDVITLASDARLDDASEQLGRSMRLYYKVDSDQYMNVAFTRLSPDQAGTRIRLPVGVMASDVALLVPAAGLTKTPRVDLRMEYSYEISFAEHFYYWFADRPMHLRSLTIDARNFEDKAGAPVRFQSFLGQAENLALEVKRSFLSMELDCWAFEGHGVVAVRGPEVKGRQATMTGSKK